MALRWRQPGSARTAQRSQSVRPSSASLEAVGLSSFWAWCESWKKAVQWLCSGACGGWGMVDMPVRSHN
eukprot:12887795-Heterocapsa_arctica.AAC.1